MNCIRKIAILFCIAVIGFPLKGQDVYHTKLLTELQENHDLSGDNWIFFDNEVAIHNNAGSYGGAYRIISSEGTDFSQLTSAAIAAAGANPWDAGWNIRNQTPIRKGDKVLFVLWLRSSSGTGEVNIFAENSTTFAKEAIFRSTVFEDWTQYLIPFESSQDYPNQTITFGLHLAFRQQTIEIGGFTALNYQQRVALSDLPSRLNNDRYDGFAEDAPWRSAAAERIETLRKANLVVEALDENGVAMEDVDVQVRMLSHDFAFGSAITASRIAGNNAQNLIYESKIHDLDGEGHGFNWVVFENDLKWPAWEEEWLVSRSELLRAIRWLRDRQIEIRGHTLVWPGANNLPGDLNENRNNLSYLQQRIDDHLEDVLTNTGVGPEIAEWDVLNEITTNRSLEEYFRGAPGYATGREILAEIFLKTRELDAATGLWLNDFVTLSLDSGPGNINYDNLMAFTRELLDAGADIEGLGFQGHIGGTPNGIPSVLTTLDDFYNEFGLKAKITEFDLPTFIDEELAANYLRDFMTAIFSHPSMNGFLFWSFWDGATYMNEGSNLFRLDWSETPAYDAFVGLVFRDWWTEETLTTSDAGQATGRIFKGLYEISYEHDGNTIRDTVRIVEDATISIAGGDLTTNTTLELPELPGKVYPNPAREVLRIEVADGEGLSFRLLDLTGRVLIAREMTAASGQIDLTALNPGMFLLEVTDGRRMLRKKVVIER